MERLAQNMDYLHPDKQQCNTVKAEFPQKYFKLFSNAEVSDTIFIESKRTNYIL